MPNIKKIAAVTGGTGFIGRRLVQRLVDEGYAVRVLMRSPSRSVQLPPDVSVVIGDLSDPLAPLEQFVQGAHVLFHCASESNDERRMYDIHVEGTRRLVKAVSGTALHWVQLSSIGAYGLQSEKIITERTIENPQNVYEKTKTESDCIVKDGSSRYGFTYSILRPSKVLGPGMPDKSLFQLFGLINKGLFFFIGSPGALANYIHVDNVVEALLLCGTKQEAHGETFNLNDRRNIEAFVSLVSTYLRKDTPRLRLPANLARLLAIVGAVIPGFPLTKGRVNGLNARPIIGTDLIEEKLGYKHKTSVEQGLFELVSVWRQDANPSILRLEKEACMSEYGCLASNSAEPVSESGKREKQTWDSGKQWMPTTKSLWSLFFCYAAFVAILFQKLLLPLIPSIHAGQGLLNTFDPQHHHIVAVNLASEIRDYGWSHWQLWPANGSGLNSSLLAVLYYFFGADPLLLVPVHAAIHASSGIIIYLLGGLLWPGRIGSIGGLIAATLFVVFPSSLNWYAQPLKDGYAIVGILLVLLSWVWWTSTSFGWRNVWLFIAGNLVGAFLLLSVRPYGLQVLLGILPVSYLIVILFMRASKIRVQGKILSGLLGLVPAFLLSISLSGILGIASSGGAPSSMAKAAEEYSRSLARKEWDCPYSATWAWQRSSWVPEVLDKYAERVSTIRTALTCNGYYANSTLDRDQMPESTYEMLSYLPRGLQVALWAPFPDTWFHEFSLTRAVGWAETITWYLLMPGVLLTFFYRRTPGLLFALIFAIGFLAVYGYIHANVGSLHRLRYPFLFVFILFGTLGWVRFLSGLRMAKNSLEDSGCETLSELERKHDTGLSNDPVCLSRKTVANTGVLVSIFTAGLYAILFLRDVIMARWFGLGYELDAFFVAMVIPMFVASVVNVPFGSVAIPLYQELKARLGLNEAQSLVNNLIFINILFLGGISLIMLLFAPKLFAVIGWGFDIDQIALVKSVLPFGASILLWSGAVVLCNSVLNANNRFIAPVIVQFVVPVIAVIALLNYGENWGVLAVAAGMAVGQIVNLLIVGFLVRNGGVSIMPKWPTASGEWKRALPMLIPLVAASLFVNAVFVIDTGMASTLGQGSVAAYGLGSKITIFVTGVIGAGIIAVMLPHFSSFFALDQISRGQHELRFYLLAGTMISIPVGLGVFCVADDIVRFFFMGGAISSKATNDVEQVASFGVIQLPFFLSYMMMMKFTNASKRNGAVLVASVFGLALNIILNLMLMSKIGVAGIALSTSLSMFATCLLLMILIHGAGHVSILDILRLLVFWTLYLISIFCIQLESYSGVVISLGAMLLFFVIQKHQLFIEPESSSFTMNDDIQIAAIKGPDSNV